VPAESQAQRRWAFGVKGEKWAKRHHFDNPGKLPKRVKKMSSGGAVIGQPKDHQNFRQLGIAYG
jgi:hypothetical protein